MTNKYYSKIDYWMGLSLIYPIFIAISKLIQGDIVGVYVLLGIVALVLLITKSTYYFISETTLVVQSTFIVNAKIPLQNIKSVKKTKTWLSSPALSLDRIVVYYNKYDEIVISPKELKAFLVDLKSKCPKIVIDKKLLPY